MAETQKENMKNGKPRCYLLPEEKDILQGMLTEWCSKPDKKMRDAFITADVLPKLQALNWDKYGTAVIERDKEAKILWERRIHAVHTWFKNNKPFKDKAVFKMERKIPLRRVIAKLRTDEIHKSVSAEHPNIEKGDKSYPGCFQRSVTKYISELGPEEREEMEKIRTEWQNRGPPVEVRLRAARKHSRKAIIDAHQMLHREMFVSCITYSFYPDPDDGIYGIVCNDYISHLDSQGGPKKFLPFKDWNPAAHKRIVADMIGYAEYVKKARIENTVVGKEIVTGIEDSPLLVQGPGGLPLIPLAVKGVRGEETSKWAGKIVREYFLQHYRMATGDKSAHTPWQTIGQEPSKFLDLNCIPAGFLLQDPSRMGKTVKELIKHLRDRQEHFGVNAFHFKSILGNHDEVQPSKYPLEAQNVISSGTDVGKWTSQPADKPRTGSVDGPTTGSTGTIGITGSDTLGVKSAKSPDMIEKSSQGIIGQPISPSSPREGCTNVMNKPLLPQHSVTRVSHTEGQILLRSNGGELECISFPFAYNVTEFPGNCAMIPPPELQDAIMPTPPAMSPTGLGPYPGSQWHRLYGSHQVDLATMLPGRQVSFPPSLYHTSTPWQHIIDPRLLPSGPVPSPNPIIAPMVQPDDVFQVRPTSGDPQYHHNVHPSNNNGSGALPVVENPSGGGRADPSTKIQVAPPQGTPVKPSPVKRTPGKRKRKEEQDDQVNPPTTPGKRKRKEEQEDPANPLTTPLRTRPTRIRKTPSKYSVDT